MTDTMTSNNIVLSSWDTLYIYMCVCVCMYVFMYVCMYIRMYACLCMYVAYIMYVRLGDGNNFFVSYIFLTPGKHIIKVLCEIFVLKLPILCGNLTNPRQYSFCVYGYIESSDVVCHIFQFNMLCLTDL
jgi:hypothetical protein